MERPRKVSRRAFVKDASGLMVAFSLVDAQLGPELIPAAQVGPSSPPAPGRLESWLRVEPDGRVRVFTGKVEIGMGVNVAFAQIVAEELDVSPERVLLVMGDTQLTPNQGGVGGSTSISQGTKPLRNVAAVARAILLQRASRQLGQPVEQLYVENGVVIVNGSNQNRVTYGDLVQSDRLGADLAVKGEGFWVEAVGTATPKDQASYRIVGTSVPRADVRSKVMGQSQYVTDVRLPGMLHGRVIRPPRVGAHLISVSEDSARKIPGYLKAVVRGDFVGVVATNEWAAIRAASALVTDWDTPRSAFPAQEKLYENMRAAEPVVSRVTTNRGDAIAAHARASTTLRAEYEYGFQSHATMGPGCAVADVREEDVTTIWSGTQKPHALRVGIAKLLDVSEEKVHVRWMEDAGSYGRPGFDDAAADAALLSRDVGKPVRVQWMRADMTAWGTKGPAVICDMSAGLDDTGRVSSFTFSSRAFSGNEIMYQPDTPGNLLAGQLVGFPNTSGTNEFAVWGSETIEYSFPAVHASAHVLPTLFPVASPLRGSHLRDPEGLATTFAAESFVDEIASAAGLDPIEFRLRYLDDERIKAALTAAAQTFGWQPSPSASIPSRDGQAVVSGRGVAVAIRNGTRVATIVGVDVTLATGAVRVTRMVCAHDCGLIINPRALRATVEGNLIQSLSRSVKEEVLFDTTRVTSVDWRSYPVAMMSDIPRDVEVILLNRPELPPTGSGEPATRPTAAAIGNAIFDATGVRVRRAPLTPERVRAVLRQ